MNEEPETLVPAAYILFADDDADQLGLMKAWATSISWAGEYVSSADAIIEAVNRNCGEAGSQHRCYDAIVADVNYYKGTLGGPSKTGITAVRDIRKAGHDIPIVFVSGHVNSVIREEARRINAEIYRKPVELDELFLRLANLIYWHRLSKSEGHEGNDRRRNSVNLSDNKRRATDNKVKSSLIVTKLLEEAQKGYHNTDDTDNTGGNK